MENIVCSSLRIDRKNAVKRIYDICIWFLDQFYLTDGFNDYWYKFKDAGANNPEFEINNLVDSYMTKFFWLSNKNILIYMTVIFMMNYMSL